MSARGPQPVDVSDLRAWPVRLDARSPAEYADDRLPGAVSVPVLDDDERALVGALHARQGAFEARKVGAALVSRRIGDIVEAIARDKPRDWAPLVYCWRGGKRSGSLAHVLCEIGFPAGQLAGGYRAWRRQVLLQLAEMPGRVDFRVICGVTGSGKSRLLSALAAEGAQVLDLEALASHRGSLLGDLPDTPQPSQRAFESAICETLSAMDTGRPVWVESESRKIGALQIPDALLARMRASSCVRVVLDAPRRVALLKEEYGHFLDDPEALCGRLSRLEPLHGATTIERWCALARARSFDPLVTELLAAHYDPTYTRAMSKNYANYPTAAQLDPGGIDASTFRAAARALSGAMPD